MFYNIRLKELARHLGKNMTDAERLMWSRLRRKQINGKPFYRQKIVGDYIVDFYCSTAELAVEIDGGQHYTVKGSVKDTRRDRYLRTQGLTVLRFSDREVFENLNGILERIVEFS